MKKITMKTDHAKCSNDEKPPNMNIFSHRIFYPMQIPKIIVFVA